MIYDRALPKKCTGCLEEKPLDEFFKRKNRKGKFVLRESTCKLCTNKKTRDRVAALSPEERDKRYQGQRKWETKNPERHRRNVRKSDLQNKYGITLEDFEKMEKDQNGVCAICFNPEKSKKGILSVDHCHSTGKVRGLLCHGCNVALGSLKDSEDNLQNAINYLKKTNHG